MPKSPERCQEIRQEMRSKILHESMLYFAKNGFSGTKISDLSQYIGIAQGTIYVYFQSKEDLFQEIFSIVNNHQDINDMKCLTYLPISEKQKILQLSHSLMQRLEQDESYAAKITLNTQMMFEKNDFRSRDTTYQSELYKYVAKIIKQGQKEKTVVTGSAMKLADYYWGVIYLYALKKLFTTKYEMISANDLARILLKDETKKGSEI